MISLLGSVMGMYVVSVAMKPREKLVLFVTRLIERTRRYKKSTSRYLKGARRSKKPTYSYCLRCICGMAG